MDVPTLIVGTASLMTLHHDHALKPFESTRTVALELPPQFPRIVSSLDAASCGESPQPIGSEHSHLPFAIALRSTTGSHQLFKPVALDVLETPRIDGG
jgi:hypothetical protein